MRVLSFFGVAFFATSCVVPPSCIDRTFGSPAPSDEHFATLTIYAEPTDEAPGRPGSMGISMGERFKRGAAMAIDSRGIMAVSGLDRWPQRCPRISREDLAEVAGTWQPVLEQMATPHMGFQVMANPYAGNDDWRPDGPLVSLSIGSTSGKTLRLLWDGQTSLPGDLDSPVMETLEMVCSNSQLAKRYLLRDLPRQLASRLECL